MLDRTTRYSPLNAENNRGVTKDVMFAYVNEKKILLSVLSIFLSIYNFDLNTQGFVYLEVLSFNWTAIEKCKFPLNVTNSYLLYGCFIYRLVPAFFLFRNKSYIFPMQGFAKKEYWIPYKLYAFAFYNF